MDKTLGAEVRREGDLSSRSGQMARLYALADQADTIAAEVNRLRKITACTMGVGNGSGRLFVHGDYDSIKAAQALLFRAEAAEAESVRLRQELAAMKGEG